MNQNRRDALLAGQRMNARRVYNAMVPAHDMNIPDIATALTKATSLKMDLNDLRGCVASLTGAGLLRQVVPGIWRRESVKEPKLEITKEPQQEQIAMPELKNKTTSVIAQKNSTEPLDCWAEIAAKLRAVINEDRDILSMPMEKIVATMPEHFRRLATIADEIDSMALSAATRDSITEADALQIRQFKAILRDFIKEAA